MSQWLKQSTAATIKMGPFVDSTDGVTAKTALTIAQADIRLTKNGGSFAQTHNAAGATHDENGYYGVPLDTTDTDTLGRLRIAIKATASLPVWMDFVVVAANVFDSLVGGGDVLDVSTIQFAGQTITCGAGVTILASVGTAATSTAQTGDAYAVVNSGTFGNSVTKTAVDAIKTKTDFLPSVIAGGAGGVFIAGTNAATTITTALTTTFTGNLTGSVGSVTGAVGSVTGSVGSVTGAVGSVTGAVGSVTGNVGGNVTGSVGSVATGGIVAASFASGAITATAIAADAIGASELATDAVAEIADAVWDELLAGHVTVGSTGAGLAAASAAGDPWATLLPGLYGAGTAGKIIGDNVDATISSRLEAASYTTPPTAASNADAVWDEARSGHTGAGTFGQGVASVQGNVTGSVGSVTGAVGSVTGAVGSVTGAVGSVTGSVGSIAANGLSASSLATDAVNEIVDQVWDEVLSGHAGVGSTGAALSAASAGSDPAAIADAVWDEAIAPHVAAGTTANALNNATAAGNPWEAVIEGAYTAEDILRFLAAVAVGKTGIVDTGGDTATVTFRDVTDASTIVTAAMAGSERTTVTLAP